MLVDVFNAILGGEPPLRSPNIWEATRFCVDTERLIDRGNVGGISYATCELTIASIEFLRECGITDVVAVVDPVFDRVMRRTGNGAYDYLGKTVQIGKARAMAGLLDCTEERIARLRAFAGIEGPVILDEEEFLAKRERKVKHEHALTQYFIEQLDSACAIEEYEAVLALMDSVLGPQQVLGRPEKVEATRTRLSAVQAR